MGGDRQLQPEDYGLTQDAFDDIKSSFDEFDRDASGNLLLCHTMSTATVLDYVFHHTPAQVWGSHQAG